MQRKIPKKKIAPQKRPKEASKKEAKFKAEAKVKVKVKRTRPLAREKVITIKKFGLHNLVAPAGAHKRKKLLGRGPGSGHGKTSTRGSKGQTSRAGRDFYLGFEGGQTPLIRRIPKRGFTSQNKLEYQIVNLGDLNKIKESAITLDLLQEKGLIKDKERGVKILGDGEIKNPLTIQAHAFSKKAAQKIKEAGGKVEIVHA
jgi:large subunit ribosomal protein L15